MFFSKKNSLYKVDVDIRCYYSFAIILAATSSAFPFLSIFSLFLLLFLPFFLSFSPCRMNREQYEMIVCKVFLRCILR